MTTLTPHSIRGLEHPEVMQSMRDRVGLRMSAMPLGEALTDFVSETVKTDAVNKARSRHRTTNDANSTQAPPSATPAPTSRPVPNMTDVQPESPTFGLNARFGTEPNPTGSSLIPSFKLEVQDRTAHARCMSGGVTLSSPERR